MNLKNTPVGLRLIVILGLLITLSGCWDLEEVDRRVFATTLGIDLDPASRDGLLLSIQIPLPQKILPPGARAGETGKKFNTISTTAETVRSAFTDLQAKTNGDLVIQQNKSLIVGEAAARRDVAPLLDWLLRSPAAPPQALVFVARHTTAQAILSFNPVQESLPGLDFVQAAQSIAKYDRTFFIPVWKFGQKLVHGTKDAYAPLIAVDPSEGQYILAGLAVFNGTRMAGELSPVEAQSFGILANLIKDGNITIDLSGGRKLTLRNVAARTRLKVTGNHQSPAFRIETTVSGSLTELIGGYLQLTPKENRRLEAIATRIIHSRLVAVLHKLQELNSDPIDFGEELRVQQPALWERIHWKKVFPTVPFTIDLKVRIRRDGIWR